MPGTVLNKYLLLPIYKLCLVHPIRAVSLILEGGALTLLMNSQLTGELATQQLDEWNTSILQGNEFRASNYNPNYNTMKLN